MSGLTTTEMTLLLMSTFFTDKYGYKPIKFSKNLNFNEFYLYNEDNKDYQLLRLSIFKKSDKLDYENYKEQFEIIRNEYGIDPEKIKFLDVRFTSDVPVDSILPFDYSYVYFKNNKILYHGVKIYEIYPTIIEEISVVTKQVNKMYIKKVDEINTPFVTYGIIILCFVFFFIAFFLKQKYDASTSYILLGADYKTFTLGLKQLYRLFTMAFSHGSIIHLLCNMFSLLSLGSYVERKYGRVKYALILSYCIIIGSLTSGILSGNNLSIGISGGLYGLLFICIFNSYQENTLNIKATIPMLLINVGLNFMPNVAWQAHLGGLVGGIIMYYLFSNDSRNNKYFAATAVLMLVALLFKYISIDTISPLYGGTDLQVVEAIRKIGLNDYADNLMKRLVEVYSKYGG